MLLLGMIYMLVFGAVAVSMAVMLLKGTKEKYNQVYLVCEGAVAIWCASQILILLAKTNDELLMAYRIGNLGICFLGAFLFYFAILYTRKKLTTFQWILPISIATFHYIIMLTNEWHHLYYKVFTLEKVEHHTFFFTNVIITYVLVIQAAGLLYKELTKRHAGRIAKGLVIAAVLLPVTLNLIYLTVFNKMKVSFDLTALGFGGSVIFILLATIKYRFMEVNFTAFDAALSSLQEGIGIFDSKENCSYYNQTFLDLMGISKEKEEPFMREEVGKRLEEMQIVNPDKEENLYKDEKERFLQVELYQPTEQNKTMVYIVKDMSKYYQLLEQTKKLAITNERLALEKERNRIAQQVHDTAGHTLTMIQSYMKLAEVSSKKQEQEKVEDYLVQAKNLSSEGIKELRQSINQLRKEAEYELVTQGIMQLADQVKEIKVVVTVQGEDSEKYSHLSKVIYDSVRETITNTLKYANATKLEIIIRFQEKYMELVLADDGIGCENVIENNGVRGIRERIEKVNGTVRFLTSKGEGFLTRIKIPLS